MLEDFKLVLIIISTIRWKNVAIEIKKLTNRKEFYWFGTDIIRSEAKTKLIIKIIIIIVIMMVIIIRIVNSLQ